MNNPFISLAVFSFISLASSYGFFRMRIPAGTIIGPICIFTLLQLVNFQPVIPELTETVIISIFGVYFATKIRGVVNLKQKTYYMPLILTSIWFIALTLFSSFVLRQLSDIGTTSSYLSVIPGGIAEMNILTLSYNANISIINTFHLTRLFSVILLVPAVLNMVYKDSIQKKRYVTPKFFPVHTGTSQKTKILPIFIVGSIGSIVFIFMGIPAGGLMGSLLFVVVFELLTKSRANPPEYLFVGIVSLLGGTIGLNIDINVFQNLSHILIPVVVITLITLTGATVLALLIHLLFQRAFLPTLLGVMPGGLAVMLSMAESATKDIFYVTSLQTVRLLTAVVIIPNLLLVFGIITP